MVYFRGLGMTDKPKEAPLPRIAKGKRPSFFDDPAVDHLLAMILELASELSATRERLAVLESVMEEQGMLAPDMVENHVLSEEKANDIAAMRQDFVARMFRTLEAEAKHSRP